MVKVMAGIGLLIGLAVVAPAAVAVIAPMSLICSVIVGVANARRHH